MANRNYQNKYASVTTVLGVLRKIGLEMWFKYNTAAFCDAESKAGREAGTDTHDVIEEVIKTGTAKIETKYAKEVSMAMQSFQLFRKEHPEFTFESTELEMTSESLKLNGTLDVIAMKDGVKYVGDWKTGKAKDKSKPDIYDEYLLQVSCYVKLYNETEDEDVQNAFILSLAKDKVAYNFQELAPTEIEMHFNEGFRPALKIYNHLKWIKEQKKEKKNVSK
jgi:hypothetical protein